MAEESPNPSKLRNVVAAVILVAAPLGAVAHWSGILAEGVGKVTKYYGFDSDAKTAERRNLLAAWSLGNDLYETFLELTVDGKNEEDLQSDYAEMAAYLNLLA